MDISGVKQIKEITTVSGTDQLNEYLKAGWVVLAVATMTTDHHEYSGPMITYSLGWTGSLPAPTPADPRLRPSL
jgi:hypothetical protein